MNIFITGTDTGVGKTVVSAILAIKYGYHYWKPIQSGLDEPTDSNWVASRIGRERVQPEVYRLSKPLSPHSAAKDERIEISIDNIASKAPTEKTIIEGCGGLLVPLNSHHCIVDLIKKLNFPALLVARSGLGTLNHTLLSLEAMRRRKLNLLGVLLVGEPNARNKKTIESFGKVLVVGEIPILPKINHDDLSSVGSLIKMENYETQRTFD